MSTITCPECGHENALDSAYCDNCGLKLPLATSEDELQNSTESDFDNSVVSEPQTTTESNFEETEEDVSLKLEKAWEEEQQKEATQELEVESTISPQNTPIRPNEPTRLDFDEAEPQPKPITSPPTTLDIREPILRLIHDETNAKFVLPKNKETVYIGRMNDEISVDIDLSGMPDADVISRVHCTIHIESQGYYLEDAGSINGTFLNAKEIKTGARYRSQIQSGDTIILGKNRQLKFTFEVEE